MEDSMTPNPEVECLNTPALSGQLRYVCVFKYLMWSFLFKLYWYIMIFYFLLRYGPNPNLEASWSTFLVNPILTSFMLIPDPYFLTNN